MAAEYVVRMGRRIAERRDELGMSQNDLARALPGKVGAQQVSKWERGLHEPRAETLEQIAAVLKVPVAHFMIDEPAKGTPDLMGALNGSDDVVAVLRQLDARLETLEATVAGLAEALVAALPQAQPERRRSAGS